MGVKIGERTVIFSPRETFIDEQYPWMVEIGNDVQITRGVIILTHSYDWSVVKKKYSKTLSVRYLKEIYRIRIYWFYCLDNICHKD